MWVTHRRIIVKSMVLSYFIEKNDRIGEERHKEEAEEIIINQELVRIGGPIKTNCTCGPNKTRLNDMDKKAKTN